jgi:hypothetical protein
MGPTNCYYSNSKNPNKTNKSSQGPYKQVVGLFGQAFIEGLIDTKYKDQGIYYRYHCETCYNYNGPIA